MNIEKRMKDTLKIMKNNLAILNSRNLGQHSYENYSKELEEVIECRNREISDIKRQCVEEFKRIKDLCFTNDYDGRFNTFKKIYEIAEDNYSILLKDLAIDEMPEKETKIIELAQHELKTSSDT